MDAGDLLDCRNADAPLLEIELLEGKAAWLNAELFRVGFDPFWNLLSVGVHDCTRAKLPDVFWL